jgi:hypothetical protein
MNLESLQLGTAFKLLVKTAPILLIRFGVMVAFWVVALIYFLIVGGVAALIGRANDVLGVIAFLVGLGATFPLYNLAYRYVFYLIKVAHIAVIVEFLAKGGLPEGTNQLEWGKKKVMENFGETSAMFVIDELVTGVVNAFTWTVYAITSWLPGDTLRTLVQVVQAVIRIALGYIDEAIIARRFYGNSTNVWENARDGLVLYAMAWKPILMNAVVLAILSYVPFVLAAMIFSLPIGALINIFNSQAAGIGLVAVLAFAWMVKVAVGDAFVMAAIIATYHHETSKLQPDPSMVDKLNQASDKFKEITQRAGEALGINRPPMGNTPSTASQ